MHLGRDTNQDRRELLRAAAMSVAASATVAILLIVVAGSGASTEDPQCGSCYGSKCVQICPARDHPDWLVSALGALNKGDPT